MYYLPQHLKFQWLSNLKWCKTLCLHLLHCSLRERWATAALLPGIIGWSIPTPKPIGSPNTECLEGRHRGQILQSLAGTGWGLNPQPTCFSETLYLFDYKMSNNWRNSAPCAFKSFSCTPIPFFNVISVSLDSSISLMPLGDTVKFCRFDEFTFVTNLAAFYFGNQ